MTTEHTPTPWRIEVDDGETTIKGADNSIISNDTSYYPSAPITEDAAFIVRACLAHEDLVAALREAQAALNGAPNTVGLHTQIDAALAKAGAA